jgi:hypothetical protein
MAGVATHLACFVPFPFPPATPFPFLVTCKSSLTLSVVSLVVAFAFFLDVSAPDSARWRFSAAGGCSR